MRSFKLTGFLLAGLALTITGSISAQEETAAATGASAIEEAGLEVVEANTLEQLLQNVKDRRVVESSLHKQREQEFSGNRDRQAQMLANAQAEKRREEQRSERLNTKYEDNEVEIGNQQELLDNRLGTLRELFGVLSQVSGDQRGVFEGSLVSTEFPNRGEFLANLAAKMGTATELATINEMEELWYLMQQEMVESGNVSRFSGAVDMLSGEQKPTDIVRVGSFNVVGDDGYLNYDFQLGKMTELARQPSGEFKNSADELYEADPGEVVGFAIDPTKGSLLALEIQRATLGEMVGSPFKGIATGRCYLPFCDGQGGVVGSIIILVGILGVLLAIERLFTLMLMARKVAVQKQNPDEPSNKNPLGRVISVYHNNKDIDTETLQLKMGEAVLQETPAITRNIAIIQVISVVAPLMGLLGTVIGMIQTFQAITLYGTGDPKIMASGISTALMTTVLGLCAAIPTVLLHALVSQRSRSVIHVLDEQSEGIIAQHAELSGQPIG